MDGVWLPLLTLAPIGVAVGGFLWLASIVRRRGVGGSVLGPIEDMWDPAQHRSHTELEILAERKAPTPAPGDPPWCDQLRN